jgi:hypothetical protein
MDCIDLRKLAGKRFRVARDEAAEHEPGGRNDPWLVTIPCQRGHFYPHSATLIGFASNSRGGTIKRLAAMPGVTVLNDGADGLNLAFPAELFPAVPRMVKPRRRRQLNQEQRDRLAAMGFKPRNATLTHTAAG